MIIIMIMIISIIIMDDDDDDVEDDDAHQYLYSINAALHTSFSSVHELS